ncbi:MAG: YccF domain-containing protein [Anaerolineae bacterium]|nr:YccF domain-containing protein [Anaerolineae bacterium]MDW8098547.1 YccF domain-containing protein [Anaerolineae bacterium]
MSSGQVTVRASPGLPLLIRVLWFILIGWELTGAWILIAWFLNLTIVGLPLGLWMLDRVPQVLTLKPSGGVVVTQSRSGQMGVQYGNVPQRSWLIRLPYFLLIGWWLSLIWAGIAWLLCATIIGLPIGVWMLHRLPTVTTLWRG